MIAITHQQVSLAGREVLFLTVLKFDSQYGQWMLDLHGWAYSLAMEPVPYVSIMLPRSPF